MWPSWNGSPPPRPASRSPAPVVRAGRREGGRVNGQGARLGDRRPGALHGDRRGPGGRADPHRDLHPDRRAEVMTATTKAGRPELVPPAVPGFSPVTGKEEVT